MATEGYSTGLLMDNHSMKLMARTWSVSSQVDVTIAQTLATAAASCKNKCTYLLICQYTKLTSHHSHHSHSHAHAHLFTLRRTSADPLPVTPESKKQDQKSHEKVHTLSELKVVLYIFQQQTAVSTYMELHNTCTR
jgi:hypothetical protein